MHGKTFFVYFSKQWVDFYEVCYMDVGDNAVADSDINDIFMLALLTWKYRGGPGETAFFNMNRTR